MWEGDQERPSTHRPVPFRFPFLVMSPPDSISPRFPMVNEKGDRTFECTVRSDVNLLQTSMSGGRGGGDGWSFPYSPIYQPTHLYTSAYSRPGHHGAEATTLVHLAPVQGILSSDERHCDRSI